MSYLYVKQIPVLWKREMVWIMPNQEKKNHFYLAFEWIIHFFFFSCGFVFPVRDYLGWNEIGFQSILLLIRIYSGASGMLETNQPKIKKFAVDNIQSG